MLFLGYKPVGCYSTRLPLGSLEGLDHILDGAAKDRKDSIAKCAVAAMRKGYHMFAVTHGGYCASSYNGHKIYRNYPKSTACKGDGEGGPWAYQVYLLTGSCN